MTDIEGFLTIYGHSDNLLNNNEQYSRVVLLINLCFTSWAAFELIVEML